jgi:hypothetical protein
MTIRSVQALYYDMKASYGTRYILTSRLNQDPEESFFSRIRGIGGTNTHPGPVEFADRFRLLLIGRNTDFIVQNAPVEAIEGKEDDNSESLIPSSLTEALFGTVQIDEEKGEKNDDLIQSLLENYEMEPEKEVEQDVNENKSEIEEYNKQSGHLSIEERDEIDCNMEALKYVAGFIAFKLKKDFPELGIPSYLATSAEVSLEVCNCPWIEMLSRGGLLIPTKFWFNLVMQFEEDFLAFHGERFCNESMVITNLVNILSSKYSKLSSKIIRKYVEVRTSVRIKFLRTKYLSLSTQRRLRKNKEYLC